MNKKSKFKLKVSTRKKIIKSKWDSIQMGNSQQRKINESKTWFFEKTSKIDKSLVLFIKEKEEA